jgi:CubicO group peptidase (beta-lactamase class C family)
MPSPALETAMSALTRRTLLAGASAGLALPACAPLAGGPRAAAPTAAETAAFNAAAAHSEANGGVSMLVMRDGAVLFERYAPGATPDQQHLLASGTKSFNGVLAAAAVQDGLLTLDEPAAEALTEWRNDERKRRITVRHLLTLTSGLQTRRTRGNVLPAAEAVQLPVVAEPGERFAYGGDSFQLFAEIIRRKVKGDPADYLQRRVLDPMGVARPGWGRVSDGLPQMAGGARLSARDWARFGEGVRLNSGGDRRPLVDPAALQACFQGTRANPTYGLTWWLNRPYDAALARTIPQLGRAMDLNGSAPFVPADLAFAAGAGKQRLYVSPAERWVVVRQTDRVLQALQGEDAGGFSDREFWRLMRGA